MSIKYSVLILVFISFASACAPQVSTSQTTHVHPAAASTSTPITPIVAVPKQKDMFFVEFFAGTWMDCRQMEPIVNGLKKKYASCMQLERVNFHDHTPWHDLLSPIGSPEFDLLTTSKDVIHRWFGVTQAEEFFAIIDPLCS